VRKLAFLLAAALAAPAAAAPPRLLVVISVDQLSADLFDQYRPSFTGGLARLSGGTVFRNGYQSHAATETCPGHSTLMTGDRPARTGIVANLWLDPSIARADKSVYCAEDERVPGSTSTAYTVSPIHLGVPTLGELLKRRSPASRTVAVAGKDRSAVMMSGQRPDQRWYWTGKAFATDLAAAPVPRSIAPTNTVIAAALAQLGAPLEPPPSCAAKARPVPVAGKTVGDGRFARAAGDETAFRASPEFDGAVLALSAALTQELSLGRGSAPDILAISLAATDYVGHTYGTGGQEMCLQLLSLDRDLDDFLGLLDRSGVDYAVALTADHGGDDLPERLRLNGVAAAARVDPALAASAVGKAVAAKLGLSGPVLRGDFAGDVYLDGALSPAERARAEREALAIYRAHPQVAAAFTKAEIAATPSPTASPDKWTLAERLRASFDPQRSGDLLIVLKPHVTPIADARGFVATHGSPWDYDRRVPILLWRPAMPPAQREEPVETVDLMPTLAAMLGLAVDPATIDGHCLAGIAGVACPPR
jgi:arylsulfatase A-like enzyme